MIHQLHQRESLYMTPFLRRVLPFLFGSQEEEPSNRVHAFTVKVAGQDPRSQAWAARNWTETPHGVFVRVCYRTDKISSERLALRALQVHMRELKTRSGRTLRFKIEDASPEDTAECLVNDAVEYFTPQLMIYPDRVCPLSVDEVQMDEDHIHGTLLSA